MARRTKRRRSNRTAMIGITLVVVMFLGVLFIGGMKLQAKAEVYAAREAKLEAELEAEMERTSEIEELKKSMQTKKYVEDVAREKLNLVYPDETIYKAGK